MSSVCNCVLYCNNFDLLFLQRSDLNMKWQLLAIGGFFVVVKFVSVYFAIQNRVFLSHVGNGGLLQVLWLWKSLLEENGDLFSAQDGSSAAGAES